MCCNRLLWSQRPTSAESSAATTVRKAASSRAFESAGRGNCPVVPFSSLHSLVSPEALVRAVSSESNAPKAPSYKAASACSCLK